MQICALPPDSREMTQAWNELSPLVVTTAEEDGDELLAEE